MRDIIFIGNSRDYHAYDWYRTVKEICPGRKVIFITDLVEGEGYDKLIRNDDIIIKLFNIDRFLLRKQSKFANLWRNLIKLIVIPFQIIKLREICKKYPKAVFHAMPMYYMFLSSFAGIKYVGTPQGSEILVRPQRSRYYRFFAKRALEKAGQVTVDSVKMQHKIRFLFNKESIVIQNGIDINSILKNNKNIVSRKRIASIRGFTPLYRISEILKARQRGNCNIPITFIYPFQDKPYKEMVSRQFLEQDQDLGRLDRGEMYKILYESFLVISIPSSDSSPRSVYEAIFCGSCIATTENTWIDPLPKCMRDRILVVDLNDPSWFITSLEWAKKTSEKRFQPTKEAIQMFDQRETIRTVVNMFY